jgi:hypothetical protein
MLEQMSFGDLQQHVSAVEQRIELDMQKITEDWGSGGAD